MKYIKLFENFEDIHKICKEYDIKNYTINPDGSIDVDGDVFLYNKGLTKLPLKFNHVSGYFSCSGNKLTTLDGGPQSVGGGFGCNGKLTTLDGGPKSVGGNFICYGNQLTTLEGSPKSIGGFFYCWCNNLTTLEGCPQSVVGDFDCRYNKLTKLEGGPKSVGGYFNCENNNILSFEGAPNHVGGDFLCSDNPIENIWYLFKDYSKVELLNDLDPIRGEDLLMDRFNTFLSMIGKDEVESVKGYNCINL